MKHLMCALGFLVSGCLPGTLSKYSRNESKTRSPVREINGDRPVVGISKESPAVVPPTAATVYAVDNQTFRFMLSKDEVWEGILDVLLKNYNLTIVDRESGIITTEWDSYFLNQVVYRNKLSIRMRANGRKSVDVVIHNNVEKLDQQPGAVTAGVWLPSEDLASESNRIAQNIAIALNQTPPQGLSTSNLALPVIETGKSVR